MKIGYIDGAIMIEPEEHEIPSFKKWWRKNPGPTTPFAAFVKLLKKLPYSGKIANAEKR